MSVAQRVSGPTRQWPRGPTGRGCGRAVTGHRGSRVRAFVPVATSRRGKEKAPGAQRGVAKATPGAGRGTSGRGQGSGRRTRKGAREEGQRGRGRSGRGDGVAGRRNPVREVRWFGRRRARAGRQAGAAERRRGRTRGRAGEAVAVVAVSGISGGGCWRHRAVRARVPGRVWRRAGRRGARQRTHARCEGVAAVAHGRRGARGEGERGGA